MIVSQRHLFAITVMALCSFGAGLIAQAPNEFDFDVVQLPVVRPWPQGQPYTVTTNLTFTGQNLEHNAPLTIQSGAELRLVNSELRVFGNIVLQEGSRLTLIDASLFLPTQPGVPMYEMHNEGGFLYTERAVIGGARNSTGSFNQSRFWHYRGTWLARQTVSQAFICLTGNSTYGYNGNPLFRGGSVFADGLYEGDFADAVHANGMGDLMLANGTMNVGFQVNAGPTAVPTAMTVDLDSRNRLNITYGDASFHQGVTSPIANALRRLELRNHRSPTWQFFAVDASTGGPLQTVTLRNAEEIICSFKGANLVGSPILGGPWASHYSQLPGLPSTQRPGFHAIPPACSVQLGNVIFQSGSGPNDWNRIRQWGLYTTGTGTNIAITGATTLAEVQMWDGGQIQLTGTDSFDMGVLCNEVQVRDNAALYLTNAALGEIATGANIQGRIIARGNSSITLNDCRHGRLLFYADGYREPLPPLYLPRPNGAPTITGQNLFASGPLTYTTANGGSISVPSSNPALQNLDFESPLVGGVPPGWTLQSSTTSAIGDPATGSAGATSLEWQAQAVAATLQRQLSLPRETSVEVYAWTKVQQTPGAGQLHLEASNGALTTSWPLPSTGLGTWQLAQVPLLTVGNANLPTVLKLTTNGLPATVRLDDFRVQLGSWWEHDNLANLAFEGGYHYQGKGPAEWASPDSWRSTRLVCEPESGLLRPGAAPGSRSMRMTLQAGAYGSMWKDLTFLRAGDRIQITGHVWGQTSTGGVRAEVRIGNGFNYVVTSGNLNFTGSWVPFTMNHVVPANPTFTRFDFAIYGVPGAQCYFDDIQVRIYQP